MFIALLFLALALLATIGYRAGAAGANGITVTTATVSFTIPAGAQDGDVAYAVVANSTSVTMTTPATGWVLVAGPISQAAGTTAWLYRKVLTAADAGTTASWVTSAAGRPTGVMELLSGVDTTTPEDATPTSATFTGSTSHAAPAITTVTQDATILNMWVARVASSTIPTITVPGTHTPLTYSSTNFATTGVNTASRAGQLTAASGAPGAKGPYSATIGNTATGVAYSIAVRPANPRIPVRLVGTAVGRAVL